MEYSNDKLEWTSGHFSSLSDNVNPITLHQKSALKSYPPSSHTLGPESSVSSHHGSLNTLQISIIALKDRLLYLGISERPVGRSEIPIYANIILEKWD